MRKISEIIKESAKEKLSIQDNTVNYLTKEELEKYLDVANKFILDATKNICKYLIDNNSTYVKDLSTSEDSENALYDFYTSSKNDTEELKNLRSWMNDVIKANRSLEIPVFMTRHQFDEIINKRASVDEVVIDLTTEAGRNAVAKKYTPLINKIVNSWIGKTSFDRDQLISAAYEGLTEAMNQYGKKSKKLQKKEQETGIEVDISKYKEYTFLQFAAQMIRVCILEAIKNESHLVRIPISRQKKEKEEKGFIAKTNSVSGDKRMGSKDGGEGKNLFDLVGGMENPTRELDKKEIDKLWKEIIDTLEDKFGEKTMDIFYNHYGWGGRQKMSGKEMAKKYGYSSPSSITAELMKVINFIKKDKDTFQKFQEINVLMSEAKHDEDEYDNDNEIIYVNNNLNKQFDALNDIDWS